MSMINTEAILIKREVIQVGKEKKNCDRLTFIIPAEDGSNEIKVLFTTKDTHITTPMFKDFKGGKLDLGLLAYEFREEYSDREGKKVWKPKFSDWEATSRKV